MGKTKTRDRRKHKRYLVKNRIFAVVRSKSYHLDKIKDMRKSEIALAVIKSNPPRMGEIIEISQGGLSFSYIDNDTQLPHLNEMDILFVDENFHLQRLPFFPVDDTSIKDEPFSALSMKRMAVQFGWLTTQQKTQLKHFLKNFTKEKVSRSGKQARDSRP